MANKLTEFAREHDVNGITIEHLLPDLESLLRGLLGGLNMQRVAIGDGVYVIEWQRLESVFSEYINLDNNG